MGSGNMKKVVDSEKKDKTQYQKLEQEESHLEPTPKPPGS